MCVLAGDRLLPGAAAEGVSVACVGVPAAVPQAHTLLPRLLQVDRRMISSSSSKSSKVDSNKEVTEVAK